MWKGESEVEEMEVEGRKGKKMGGEGKGMESKREWKVNRGRKGKGRGKWTGRVNEMERERECNEVERKGEIELKGNGMEINGRKGQGRLRGKTI